MHLHGYRNTIPCKPSCKRTRLRGAFTFVFASLAAIATLVAPHAGYAEETFVRDNLGNRIHITPQSPQRIVALAPHLCELVYTAGAGKQLIAVSAHCDYPPEVSRLPRVADYRSINFEQLAQLKPDLILVWKAGLREHQLAKLRLINPRVYISDPHDFQAVADNLINIGILTGNNEAARREADLFISNINSLETKYRNTRKVKALYLIHTPPPVTINQNHWISRLLTLCGAQNVFADAPTQVVKINTETLLLNPPDLIVHSMQQTPALTG